LTRFVLDRDASTRTNDLGNRHVLELLAIPRAAKKESATGQLADVQYIARKDQPITKDRREQIGVLARTH
jgi:hypothetical protein